jgi:hypothetical protein
MTTALQCINSLKPYTLAGFEPGIFCSVGGPDDHYATPPRQGTAKHFKTRKFRYRDTGDKFHFFRKANDRLKRTIPV